MVKKQGPSKKLQGQEEPTAPPEPVATPISANAKEKAPSIFQLIRNVSVQRALQLVVVAAISSPLSQLNLSPVYGSIPASIYHRYGLIVCILLAFALRGRLPSWTSRSLPALVFWIPSIQFVLFQCSSVLGASLGPPLTETLTYYPLLILSMYMATQFLEQALKKNSGGGIAEATPAMGLMLLFTIIQRSAKSWLTSYIGRHFLFSRIGLQVLLGLLYSMILLKSSFWPAMPSMVFTFIGNPHTPLTRGIEICNSTLAMSNFTLLERTESVTGYISVLQSQSDPPFRVLRCDQSLLGGSWILPPRASGSGPPRLVPEPIYAIFTMLEGIRLVEPAPALRPPETQLKALNIGAGIGTAPTALHQHGINTTIIELDPAVIGLAVKWFGLSPNQTVHIGDAVAAIHASALYPAHHQRYHYIIHDVFTGGAEPAALFTSEFFTAMSKLLKDDGAVAINYAGDLSQPSTSLVYRTITSVFANCRVFREEPPLTPDSSTHAAKAGVDFTNMVFFCRKRPSAENAQALPLKFRKPTEADYLGSSARKENLLPKYEVQPEDFEREGEVLTEKNIRVLEKQQMKSALGHWKVMRGVLPDAVWETW